jgi:hypothetical protein
MQIPQRLQSATQALRAAGAATLQELGTPSVRRRVWSFVFSLVFVLLILIAWNLAQNIDNRRLRLWGEFLFVILVIWLALVVLSGLGAKWIRRVRLLRCMRIHPLTRPEALVWAGVTIATVPLLWLFHWDSVVVFVAALCLAALLLVVLRRRSIRARRLPYYVVPLTASLILGAAAWWWEAPELETVTLAQPTRVVPSADSVASSFRPLLFFDTGEAFEPADIADSTVHGCSQGIGAEECNNPVDPAGPLDEFDYVTVEGTELRPNEKPGGPDSAYYHHVVRNGDTVYIDYWWYFARNPAPVARGILCGQALRWLSVACAEHPADWEGITLVLVSCPPRSSQRCVTTAAGSFRVVDARYAQHEKVVTYSWELLQRRWRAEGYADWFKDAGHRPLVFVALNSHASYAGACAKCDQIAHPAFKERRNGKVPWQNNFEDCGDDCLKPVPVGASGEPVGWNAFRGRWGTRHCILFGSYCDIQQAPRAPSFQSRYRRLDCPPTFCMKSKDDRL